MSSPTAQCTITGSWPETDGTTATGRYLVTPTYEALGDGVLVPVTDTPVTLDANGLGTRELTYVPGQTSWKITEQIDGADNEPAYIVTPDGPTLDLSTAPRSTPTNVPVNTYVLASTRGVANGYTPLDGTAHVPQAYLPATAAGVQGVTAADGTVVVNNADPQNPTVRAGAGIPQASVTGLITALSDIDTELDQLAGAVIVTGSPSPTNVPTWDGVHWVPQTPAGGGGVKAFTSRVFQAVGASITPPDSGGQWITLKQADAVSIFSVAVPAAVGDLLTVNQNNMFKATDSTTHLDLAVIVAGAPQTFLSAIRSTPAVEGDPGWYPNAPDFKYHPAPPEFLVESGMIEGGTVTVAVVYRGGTGILDRKSVV